MYQSCFLPKMKNAEEGDREKPYSTLGHELSMYDCALTHCFDGPSRTPFFYEACNEFAQRVAEYVKFTGDSVHFDADSLTERYEQDMLKSLTPLPADSELTGVASLSIYSCIRPNWDVYTRPYLRIPASAFAPHPGIPSGGRSERDRRSYRPARNSQHRPTIQRGRSSHPQVPRDDRAGSSGLN